MEASALTTSTASVAHAWMATAVTCVKQVRGRHADLAAGKDDM